MDLACNCWSESVWEAPWTSVSLMVMEQRVSASCIEWAQVALASLMVVEQKVLASWVEWAQTALASLIDSVVAESFWWRAMLSSQTNFHQLSSMDDLVASSLPRALLASSQRWPTSVVGVPALGPGVSAVGEEAAGISFREASPISEIVWCFCSLFSYHSLLELHYENKRNKTLTAKEWVGTEGLSFQETECHMDIDMFLDEYLHWEAEGLPHPLILQEMFLHAAHSGRREAVWMICQGCKHGLPCFDPQVNVSAIWSIKPHTSREEIRDLYYKVYKLRRLPRSPLCWPKWAVELTRDMVSSLKDHLKQKEDELQRGQRGSGFADTHPTWNRTPWVGGEVLWQKLNMQKQGRPTTIALEEKIERLNWSITRDHPDTHAHSQSCDQWRRRSQGQSQRHHKALPESSTTHPPTHSPPWLEDRGWTTFPGVWPGGPTRAGAWCGAFLPGPGWQVWGRWRKPSFCRTPSGEIWRVGRVEGQVVDTPSWWQELEKIPEVDNVQELAQKIWASFELPQWTSEVYDIENYYLAPLVPKCLHWKDFLLLPDPRFPCQAIQEEQQKKTMTSAQALQYWTKRANLPMLCWPHLLSRSILELCEMMEWYISFSHDIALGDVALLEGFFRNQAKLTIPRDDLPTSTDVPTNEFAMEEAAPLGVPSKNQPHPGYCMRSRQR